MVKYNAPELGIGACAVTIDSGSCVNKTSNASTTPGSIRHNPAASHPSAVQDSVVIYDKGRIVPKNVQHSSRRFTYVSDVLRRYLCLCGECQK